MEKRVNMRCTNLLFVLFGIGLLVGHIFIITGTNDDAWFSKILNEYELFDFLAYRYQSWTSRLFIEAILVFFSKVNPWMWKICNVLILLLLVHECCYIWGKKCHAVTISVFMLLELLMPVNMLCSAGWIATTINYLWPITIGIYTLIPIVKWFRKQKVSKIEYILGCISCLFGCSHEQMAAVLFVVYIFLIIYYILTVKKVPVLLWIYSVLSTVMLIFILTCPGNATRVILETQTWFPEFVTLSTCDKLVTGILTTFSYYISCRGGNVIFLLFTYVLMLAVICIEKRKIIRCFAIYPFVVTLLWGFMGRVIVNMEITSKIYWLGLIQNDKVSKLSVYASKHIVIEVVVFLSILCSVLISLYIVYGKKVDFLLAMVVVLASFCSNIVMGLSPTVYVSGMRTPTLGCVGLIIAIFMCVQRCFSKWSNKKNVLIMLPFYTLCLFINIIVT